MSCHNATLMWSQLSIKQLFKRMFAILNKHAFAQKLNSSTSQLTDLIEVTQYRLSQVGYITFFLTF